jgi:quercetin dioxygenase-like cupin family protein
VLDSKDYPRPLQAVGEAITVLASGNDTAGYEIFLQEGQEGTGPRPHHHPWDESFFVLRGEIDFNIDSDRPRTAVAGTLVHIPAGTTHGFRWRAGGGAMLSMTSRLAASGMFADIDRAHADGPPTFETMDKICAKYGCT